MSDFRRDMALEYACDDALGLEWEDKARALLALDTAHRAAVQAERDRILAAADAFVGAKADALHDTCTEYNEGAMDSAVQLRDAIAALRQGAA
jgi:hypothetical protein